MTRKARTTSLAAAVLTGVVFVATPAAGQDTPTLTPSTPPSTSPSAPSAEPASRPLTPALDQLNRETVALYERLQGSVMRVQMPTPVWVDNAVRQEANRFNKYKNLPPDIRNKLSQSRGNYGGNSNNDVEQNPPAQQRQAPAEQPPVQAPSRTEQLPQRPETPGRGGAPNDPPPVQGGQSQGQQAKEYVLVVPSQQPMQQAEGNPQQQQQLFIGNRAGTNNNFNNHRAAQAEAFLPNAVGLLLDDQGHVLVPTYIEREAVGETPVRLVVGEAVEPVEARFIGSDEQTQLTVLKLVTPPEAKDIRGGKAGGAIRKPVALGKPIQLARKRLPDGSLVVLLSTTDGVGRLTVWNGGTKETGVVVTIDGEVAGIARFGQFLSGPACQLIADHIIRHGVVRRATLGVIITQVDAADPIRQQLPELADRPALHVDQVVKGSVADRGGLKVGDLILAVGAEAVHDIPSLAAVIAGRNGPTTVRVLRDGKPALVTVDLAQNDAVLTK